MLAGYYDDSVDDQMFLVAGFVAEVSRWEAFTDEWQRKLKESPAITHYKAYDAKVAPELRKSDNVFWGFSRSMIAAKENVLATVIAKHVEYSVYSPIRRTDFETIVRPKIKRNKHGLGRYVGHEYHFPFHGCIAASIEHLKANNINDQIDFFFDDQGKVGKWSRDMYDNMKGNDHPELAWMQPYLGVCVPHDDKKVVALQAADLFASRVRRWGDDDNTPITDPALIILAPIPCKVSYWRPERLRTFIEKWFPMPEESNGGHAR